jgi:hypothetical protein
MLATAVLLAGCVHDTDDYNFFVAESGASLTYYIGSGAEGSQKAHDDPWNTIQVNFSKETTHTGTGNKNGEPDDPWDTIGEKFGVESVHAGNGNKNGEPDDPWDTITDKFGTETVHTGAESKNDEPDDPWNTIKEGFAQETVRGGKSEEEDPWNRINSLFPLESVHTGKTNDRYFLGFEKSVAVFVSFTYQMSTADRARVVEVRGNVLKLEFADGVVQYVIDAPETWTEGTQLVTGFLDATSKKDRPFLGVRFWRTMKGSQWGPALRDLALERQTTWPQDYFASGASLLVGLPEGQKTNDDPWTKIGELFAKNSGGADDPWDVINEGFPLESVHTGGGKSNDDPWDSIRENFSVESVHTRAGKTHDDPWDTINDNFSIETVQTGKAKVAGFGGKPIVKMLFVSVGDEKGEAEDPWDRIGALFPTEKNAGVELTLVEVRGQVGRFASDSGRSIFGVAIPAGWEPGLVVRGKAYLLDTKKMLPLMGAVTWEVDRALSPGPFRFAASPGTASRAFRGPRERGDVADVGGVKELSYERTLTEENLNHINHD